MVPGIGANVKLEGQLERRDMKKVGVGTGGYEGGREGRRMEVGKEEERKRRASERRLDFGGWGK